MQLAALRHRTESEDSFVVDPSNLDGQARLAGHHHRSLRGQDDPPDSTL